MNVPRPRVACSHFWVPLAARPPVSFLLPSHSLTGSTTVSMRHAKTLADKPPVPPETDSHSRCSPSR